MFIKEELQNQSKIFTNNTELQGRKQLLVIYHFLERSKEI